MTLDVARLAADYRRQRDALELFDVNCWLGRPLEPAFTTIAGVDNWKAALAALRDPPGGRVAHVVCRLRSRRKETEPSIEAIQDGRRVRGGRDAGAGDGAAAAWSELLRTLIAQRVRLVRLFPTAHNFLLAGEYLGGMLEAVQQLRLPLMVWHTQTTWPAIAQVCASNTPTCDSLSKARAASCSTTIASTTRCWLDCPNLFLETHNLVNYLGLDDLVSRFGSERFLFGSYFPHLDPNSAAMLLCARRHVEARIE